MPKYMGQSVAEKLGNLKGLASDDQEVIAYGLEYLLINIIGVVLTLSVGLSLGLFWETVVVLISWGILRPFAGGTHCTARWRCIITSCLLMVAVIFLTKAAVLIVSAATWAVLCSIWTTVAIWLWAPNNSARVINDPQRRRRLRLQALILAPATTVLLIYLSIIGNEIIQSVAVMGAAGFAAGAFMLSSAGFQLMAWSDKILELLQSYFTQRR